MQSLRGRLRYMIFILPAALQFSLCQMLIPSSDARFHTKTIKRRVTPVCTAGRKYAVCKETTEVKKVYNTDTPFQN